MVYCFKAQVPNQGKALNFLDTKNSILIIDDEKSNLLYLNHILGSEYTVYTAGNAQTGISMALKHHPDLILLDILMPDMDGYQTLAILKKAEETSNIPVIFITGLDSREDEELGLVSGAEDYITKPFSATIVNIRIRNQIKIINQMRAIERLSTIDQLTEIPNKRSFNNQLSMEWRRAIRNRTPISVMMIDVDKFKNYNDKYGHLQGDVALQAVAHALTQTLKRPADFAARWGGEEFAVLLPATDIDGALVIAELIRESVENLSIPYSENKSSYVTISVGVNSQVPSHNDSMDDFIYNSDMALYTAKKTGRNRVCRST